MGLQDKIYERLRAAGKHIKMERWYSSRSQPGCTFMHWTYVPKKHSVWVHIDEIEKCADPAALTALIRSRLIGRLEDWLAELKQRGEDESV